MATFKLGITGGIGSGKSGVASLLRVMGVPVYDCDAEARRLMNDSPAIRSALVALAGGEVYGADGCLQRSLLAAFMFGHPDRVQAVNAIVHPAVRADFRRWASRRGLPSIVALESAILFESGLDGDVDAVAVVTAPLDERIARTMARDGSTREQVLARMASQLSDDERVPKARFVIRNAEADAITPQVTAMMDTLMLEQEQNTRPNSPHS